MIVKATVYMCVCVSTSVGSGLIGLYIYIYS